MRISGAFCSSSCPALSACGLAETDTIQKRRRRRIILLRRVFHGMRSKHFLEQSEKRVRSRSPLLEVDGRWFHLLQTTHLPCESSLDEGSTRSHYNNMSAFTGQRTAKNTTVCGVSCVSCLWGVCGVSGVRVWFVCCVLCFVFWCVCVCVCWFVCCVQEAKPVPLPFSPGSTGSPLDHGGMPQDCDHPSTVEFRCSCPRPLRAWRHSLRCVLSDRLDP